jgi:glycosyltransferase involved in cell wall biosynthesis
MQINVSLITSILARAQKTEKQLDGIGVYTTELLKQLRKNNKIKINQIAYQGDLIAPLGSHQDIQFTRLGFKTSSALSYTTRIATPGLAKLLNNQHLLHCPDHCIAYTQKIPMIASIMDVIPMSHPEYVSNSLRAFKSQTFKFLASRANHLITISEFSADQITKVIGYDREKITVTHLGVDPDYFIKRTPQKIEEVKAKYNVSKDYFIFVGTLQPRKNVHRLVQAYISLPSSIRQSIQLLVVGRAREDMQALVQLLSSNHNSSEIKWLKYVPDEDVKCLLQGAQAMVYPSLYEGFGLPIVEAFASETPVITSSTTSMPEIAGDAAFYVDPESVNSIRSAMLEVVDNSTQVNEKIRKGLIRAKKFNWQSTAAQTVTAYEKVLGITV